VVINAMVETRDLTGPCHQTIETLLFLLSLRIPPLNGMGKARFLAQI
jgi:hypothetical protein